MDKYIAAKVGIHGTKATVLESNSITVGLTGAVVQLIYDDDLWQGMRKKVTFRGPCKIDVLTDENEVQLPWEVTTAKNVPVCVGVTGVDAAEKVLIPTVWATIGTVLDSAAGHNPAPGEPVPPVWAQVFSIIGELEKLDTENRENLVAAINEVLSKVGTGGGNVDLSGYATKEWVKRYVEDSGGNVDLTGYLKLPTDEDGKPNYGTAGHYAVSDGNGGITWVEAGNSGGSSGGDTPVVPGSHGIVWDLVNVTSSNPITSVSDGASLVAVLTPADGFTLGDVIVTMGSEVLTGVWNADTATVTIVAVTGDVIISCSGVEGQTSKTYTAEFYNKSNSTPYTITDNGDGTYPVSETAGVSETGNYYAIYKFSEEAANHNGGTLSFELLSDDYSYYEIRFLFVDANMCHKEGPVSGGGETYYYAFGTTSKPAEGELSVLEWVYAKGDGTEWHRKSVFGKSAIIPGVPAGTYPIVLVGGLFDSSGTSVGATTLSAEVLQELFSFKLTTDVAEKTSVAEIVDADYLQDYGIATTSLVTDVEDTTTFKGVLETAKNEWMLAYGGDMNKIPLIIHTDQHGCLARGNVCGDVFAAISNMVNWYDISKVVNLGDTANDYPNHEDLTAGSVALENYLDAMKEVPYSKRIEIFGNHDVSYFDGPMLTAIYHDQSYLQPYFRNIFARRVSNNGYFAIKDDNFNVKYVAISNMEYDETFAGKHIMSTKQIEWLISEFSKADGYDVVLLSHMPCTNSYFELTNIESIITARKSKTSGTMTDAYGVQHTFDFSNCDGELLCSLNGHMHEDANGFTGELAYAMFQNFYASPRCLYFVLIDRANRQLNIWKVDSTPQYQNFQVPLDKPAE